MVVVSRPNGNSFFVFTRFNKKHLESLYPCFLGLGVASEQVLFLDDISRTVKQRKINFDKLLEFANVNQISQVFVGNDRHIEFQFLAHRLKKQNNSIRCIYLDEGLYSYIGRKASMSFSEQVIDQVLKKIIYGFWWQTPKTIGASSYIDEVWLAYPNQACSMLKSKKRVQLPIQGFEFAAFKEFVTCWGGLYNLPSNLHDIDFVLTITDKKNFIKFPCYEDSIKNLVSNLVSQGHNVAVKYHPNAGMQDLLSLASISKKIKILPSSLPFEVILPLLSKATLIAEFSSTLITSRLLNPNMRIWSTVHAGQLVPADLRNLFDILDIQSASIDEIKLKSKVE